MLAYFEKLLQDLDRICSLPMTVGLEELLQFVADFHKSQPNLLARALLQVKVNFCFSDVSPISSFALVCVLFLIWIFTKLNLCSIRCCSWCQHGGKYRSFLWGIATYSLDVRIFWSTLICIAVGISLLAVELQDRGVFLVMAFGTVVPYHLTMKGPGAVTSTARW